MQDVTRRRLLAGSALLTGAALGPWVLRAAAQGGPLKVGLVLPYTGVYAVLGESITQGMELVFARENWTVAGRKIEMIKEDDEMKPPVGIRKTEKLIAPTRSTSSPAPCTAASSSACATRSTRARPS
jgi:branched-chain amino acid transport system substrate-binding protein